MTKKNIFNLVIAMCIASLAGAQCLGTPTAELIVPGVPDGNGTCSFNLEMCVNVIEENTVRRIIFSSGGVTENLDANGNGNGNGNATFSLGQQCATLSLTLDCNISTEFSATITGLESNGNGNECSSFTGDVIPTGGSSPLPVELISFRAELQNNDQVMIEWSTASEENNDYFELQHSTNGRDFEAIAKINGNGTTDDKQYYVHFDESPERGYNYYRIKQVDYDGKFEIFDMAVVKVDATEIFKVFPARTNDQIIFESPIFADKDQNIELFNSSGVLMTSKMLNAGSYKLNFDVQTFPAGIYFLRFINEYHEYETLKFIKVRD
ncbi:MAG: T9SS type A sorting domain-containing protein [Saprospiraceae bacterium]